LGLLYKPGKKVTAAMDFASVAILIWNCQLFGAQNQLKISVSVFKLQILFVCDFPS
jgi:hypothetical protein